MAMLNNKAYMRGVRAAHKAAGQNNGKPRNYRYSENPYGENSRKQLSSWFAGWNDYLMYPDEMKEFINDV